MGEISAPRLPSVVRKSLAIGLIVAAAALPLLAFASGWTWYVDGPMVLVALVAGFVAGAWLSRPLAAAGVCATTAALVVVNQMIDAEYHWLDDTVFFLLVVGGPALVGALLADRAAQVHRLQALQAELDEQQRVDVAAARLDEQSRVQQDVHARMAERVAGIVLRAEGARRAHDATALPVLELEARGVLDQLRETLGSMSEPAPLPDVRRAARAVDAAAVAARRPAGPRPRGRHGRGVGRRPGDAWTLVGQRACEPRGGHATGLATEPHHPRRGRLARGRHPHERLAHTAGHHGDAGGSAGRHVLLHRRLVPGSLVAGRLDASRQPAPPASTSPPARRTTWARAPG